MSDAPPSKRVKKESRLNISRGGSVLEDTTDAMESEVYHPSSQMTAGVYKEFLSELQTVLVSESSEALYDYAHECISIYRADLSDASKLSQLRELLPSVSDELFSSLFRLSRLLTDFDSVGKLGLPSHSLSADGGGIAVTFDEEEEKHETLSSDDDEDEVYLSHQEKFEAMGKKYISEDVKLDTLTDDPFFVAWSEMEGGYWLRRQLARLEPNMSEDTVISLEQAVFEIFSSSDLLHNVSMIENKLFSLFKFRHVDFCKRLVLNRYKVWASRLDESGLKKFLVEISKDPKSVDFISEVSASTNSSHLRRPAVVVSGGSFPAPSQLLDLANITFNEGGRLMSNPAYVPATKTFQTSSSSSSKNYDEVHVEAPEKVVVRQADLVNIKLSLPEWAHPAFAGLENLNPVQSKVFPIAFGQFTENMMICAPTGAGKTNIAMLTIMNVLGQYMNSTLSESSESSSLFQTAQFKMVYIAPMKALVQEVVKSFSLRLGPLGIAVGELSGDASMSRDQIAGTQLIVTTPEKWDVITRKSGESVAYTKLVRLIIIDEIQEKEQKDLLKLWRMITCYINTTLSNSACHHRCCSDSSHHDCCQGRTNLKRTDRNRKTVQSHERK